jgi:ABC-type glutathione transport system ATPase component
VVIVGASGAGKSTVLRTIARLLPLESGTLRAPASIGWLPQHPLAAFDPRWTVLRSVCEPLRLAGESRTEARTKAVKLLQSVKLSRMQWDLRPAALSGGQLRRAAISRAIAASPRVVLADEPTAGLDPEAALSMVDLFRELTAIHGTSVVWVTHDLGIASAVADRVLVLSDGRIVEAAPMDRLAVNPQTAATRQMLDAWLPLDPEAARRQFGKPGSVTPNPAAWITVTDSSDD